MFNPSLTKIDFPILSRLVHGKPLVYLDNAATTQKPNSVIDAISNYYKTSNANTHRGVHTLGEESTEIQESGRQKVADFINADYEEIVFTRNATEALNLVAYSYGLENIKDGDVIVTTRMEHHANVLPWQMVAEKNGARLEYWEIENGELVNLPSSPLSLRDISPSQEGRLSLSRGASPLDNPNVKLLVIAHASNVLATINPIKDIVKYAHERGIVVVVDGAQAVPNMKVDVKDLDADFYAFSGHKMCGPMGIGVLYGKKELLDKMPPFLRGGSMIDIVEDSSATWNKLPWKFEAGTPDVASVAGLVAAIDYLQNLGLENIFAHEQELGAYTIQRLSEVEGIEILGSKDPSKRVGLVSFTMDGVHPHDISTILDEEGIAIRAGHHCAQPLHRSLNKIASARISPYIYNTKEDIDKVVEALGKVKSVFQV